jgi:Fe-S oxidoreductase
VTSPFVEQNRQRLQQKAEQASTHRPIDVAWLSQCVDQMRDKDTLIVADGTSCRHQIHDGAQREALHVARVLAMSLDRATTNSHPAPVT